ncbi:MAG TPA: tetratricopeptide repeat protein [Ktedonobacteraceae bacterium]|nr:tetratricopeptide repeat protein [Ktedonobacteraceae bacterium]
MESPHADPQPRVLLTEARVRRSWSQQEVANRLGTTHVNVSRWERGLTKPNPYYRRKLCMLFGLTEEELGLFARAGSGSIPTRTESSPAQALQSPVPPPSPVTTAADSSAGRASDPAAPPNPVGIQPPAPTPMVPDVIYDPAIPLVPAVELVGRSDLLTALRRRLRTGGSVALTALNGLPGVGKTALSVTLAHDPELRSHFRDGILWAGLGPDPNVPGLLSRWGSMLGISASEMAALSSNEAWARAIRAAIGMRALLLVIDDAWTIEDALIFKVGGPRCAHLVTTRFGTIAVQIAGDGATNIHELTIEQGLELLTVLAPQAVAQDEEKARDLVQAVGGLPLAITLIGNYLRKQSYSGQTRRIRAALTRLSDAAERLYVSEPRGPSETHPSLPLEQQQISLQTVIAVTDQQLDAKVRTAFYALAVFPPKPNSFSEDAALAITNSDFDTIDTLADTGLLESSGEGRYTIHQTIADYVRVHLQDAAPHERLIQYAIQYVEENKKDYSYELLDRESSTILAALDSAYTHGKQAELVRLVNAYIPTMLRLGFYPLAEQHVKRMQEISREREDSGGNSSALLYLGQIAQKQGELAEAESFFKEGLELARQLDDKERISAFLTGLGETNWRRGDFTQAEIYLQEGLSIAQQLDNKERTSVILKNLGSVAANQGDFSKEEMYLKEGLQIARQIGDREQTCVLLMNLGAADSDRGNYVQAEKYFQEGLTLARQIGHREWISGLLSNLGNLFHAQGNYILAEKYFQEGLELARQIGHREWTSILLNNLGMTASKQEKYFHADAYLQESLTLARQIGIPQITGNVLNEYGDLCIQQKNFQKASTVYQEMLTIISEDMQDLMALANYGVARVALAGGNTQEALKFGEMSMRALETMEHRKTDEVKQWLSSVKKLKN